ncbi:MAG: hypothetical protein M3Y64_08010, partial [Gemmatimonadota bacterium]|nr:hypothetical protein [Gemmatimonadota bacterium]
ALGVAESAGLSALLQAAVAISATRTTAERAVDPILCDGQGEPALAAAVALDASAERKATGKARTETSERITAPEKS